MRPPWKLKPVNKITANQREVKKYLEQVRRGWWDTAWNSGTALDCALCGETITRYEDLTVDHKIPGKMGGCKDHSPGNLQPAHTWCNNEKGSQRIYKHFPGKPMSKTAINYYLIGEQCFCGDKKETERPCCLKCYALLSPQIKHDLERTPADALEFDDYQRLLLEVDLTILRAEAEKRSA